MKKYILYTDGASRGNPGPAGIGAYICDLNGQTVAEVSKYIGETTNNVAEYKALLFGLEKLIELKADEVEIRADSELLVKQIKGIYRVKHPNLIPLFAQVKSHLAKIPRFAVRHVERALNKEADRLANRGIDEKDL